MMMKKRAKKNNRGGFTLVETLVAVLILLLVSMIVAGGLPTAARALSNAVDASHGQVLLSTTMTALRDELSTAKDFSFREEEISYTDASGATCVIKNDGTNGIRLEKQAKPKDGSGPDVPGVSGPLVSRQAATSGLYTKFSGASFSDGIVKIKDLEVWDGDHMLTDLSGTDFEIEVIGKKG